MRCVKKIGGVILSMGALIILVALCMAAVLYKYVIFPVTTKRYVRELLSAEGADAPDTVAKLLRSFLPDKNVFVGISLPIPDREGEEIYYGTVDVTEAGILIITRICGSGMIENPQGESIWRFLSNGSVREFPNPFKEQDSPRRLLSLYAELAGIEDVNVRTLVVYTDEELKFSDPPPKGILHISALYARVRRLSAKGNLTNKNVCAIVSALKDACEG